MKLVNLQEAIKKAFQQRWPDMSNQIDIHPGRFSVEELTDMAIKAPALRFAILAMSKGKAVGTGEIDRDVKFAAFLITDDKKGLTRAEAALNIVEDIITFLPGQTFDVPEVEEGHIGGLFPIEEEAVGEAQNLHSKKLGRRNVSVWGIAWTQKIRFGENEFADSGILPSGLYVGQSPEIGSDHIDDYEHITVGGE